ncbi:uncharacterized protein [Pseudorasbora parva]|uniref:uncharacterized protein n=1 Tax=Pseudorasbora parva TaxID=51549 RepID=UPI00351F1192
MPVDFVAMQTVQPASYSSDKSIGIKLSDSGNEGYSSDKSIGIKLSDSSNEGYSSDKSIGIKLSDSRNVIYSSAKSIGIKLSDSGNEGYSSDKSIGIKLSDSGNEGYSSDKSIGIKLSDSNKSIGIKLSDSGNEGYSPDKSIGIKLSDSGNEGYSSDKSIGIKLSDSINEGYSSDKSIGIKLSDSSNEGYSSNKSIGIKLSDSRVLKEHGYAVKRELGQGSSGTVYLVTNTDGDLCVVKVIDYRDNKEVEILRSLKYGYIVTYEDSFKDEDNGQLFVVMEYCAGGDLHKAMQTQKEKGIFEERQIIDWLVQICLALQYVHEKHILHRDIKPKNIFLAEDGYINVGDFGCSRTLQRADAYAESVVGAELYKSPEVFQKKYKSKSDIWSLGWVLHDLCMLDVWSDVIERRYQHVNSLRGKPTHISERYSEELRTLIRQMLSRDPKDRPSADEILAQPFLREAVDRNSRIPDTLERRFIKSIKTFNKAYSEHYIGLETLVREWGETTDSLEKTHYDATAASLSGAVIGTAGGIAAVVGVCLAPVTLGASLIVTGIGVGVGVAGGVTGAASNITNTVKQKSFKECLQQIEKKYQIISEKIFNPLNEVRRVHGKLSKFCDFASDSSSDNVQMMWGAGRGAVGCAAGIISLGMLANVGRIAVRAAEIGRAAAAVSGVLSGLLVIADTAFIVMDAREIHQMRQQGKTDDPKKVSSRILKAIAQMRKTHKELQNVLKEIKEAKEELRKYM